MVVILADSGGNALVVDLDREDAVSVANELGVHREVLGALGPRIDRGVLPDNLVLVRVVKVKTVVHVVLSDGGDGLADDPTILDSVHLNCLSLSDSVRVNLVVLDPLHEGLIFLFGIDVNVYLINPHLELGIENTITIKIIHLFGLLRRKREQLLGGEALDLHGVHSVNDSLRNEHEARRALRHRDLELLITGGDGDSVSLGVIANGEEALGEVLLLGRGDHDLARLLVDLVLVPASGLGVGYKPAAVLAFITLLALVTLRALGRNLEILLADPPVAVLADERSQAVLALLAFLALLTLIAFLALVALRALGRDLGVSLADPPVTVLADVWRQAGLALDTLGALDALLALVALVALVALGAVENLISLSVRRREDPASDILRAC